MSDLVVAASQMVAGAVVQEFVSRAVSFALGKRKEKASQGEYLERLQKAVHEVEFMQERTAKLPITEVSLLRQKIELKLQFMEAATCLLSSSRKKRQDTSQVVTRSSSAHSLATRPAMLSVSSAIATSKDELWLSFDDVERFERLADSARSILTRVESGCSLRRWMHFSCPLARHLFEWKTLFYRKSQLGQMRAFEIWPARLEEERGIEAVVRYRYWDYTSRDKNFDIGLVLRLSESTDIVAIAIKCLQSLATISQFNLVAETAIVEQLTVLGNLQDISYRQASKWVGIKEWHAEITQNFRPDPLCCNAKGHTPCDNKVTVSSEISQAFPEEVTFFRFECYISTPAYNLRSSADARGKSRSVMRNGRRPPLRLAVHVVPHMCFDEYMDKLEQASYYAAEVIADNDEEQIDVKIQQAGEMVRPRAINCFLRHPHVTDYHIRWVTKHGGVEFGVSNAPNDL